MRRLCKHYTSFAAPLKIAEFGGSPDELRLEQRALVAVGRDSEMLVGQVRGHAAAGRAVEEADLDEKGLVDLLDGVGFLGERRARVFKPTGPPWYFSMMVSNRAVDFVEAVRSTSSISSAAWQWAGRWGRCRAPGRSRARGAAGGWRCAACHGSGCAISAAPSDPCARSRTRRSAPR